MSGLKPTMVMLKSPGTGADYKKFDSMVNKEQIGKNTQVANTYMFTTPGTKYATESGFRSGPPPTVTNQEILDVSMSLLFLVLFGIMIGRIVKDM